MVDGVSDALDDAALAVLERRIDEWLAAIAAGWLPVEAIERGEGDERRWYVRLRGEDKDFTTVWLTLGQRTLRYETYVMPAPEENDGALYEHLLRRNERLVGAHFSIGIEDAVFLRGELPVDAADRGRARPGHRHAVRHRRAVLPGPAAHRLRQPLRWPERRAFPLRPTQRRTRRWSSVRFRVASHSWGCPGRRDSGMSETSATARTAPPTVRAMSDVLVIVGGGNMGAALLGGLLAADGADPAALAVIEALAGAARRAGRAVPRRRRVGATCRRARPP